MPKKVVLIALVLSELIIGYAFLDYVYSSRIGDNQSVLGASKVARIDKETILIDQDYDLQYYWVLAPNMVVKDKPEWLPAEVEYTYNADALNDRFNYEVSKPPDTFRILTQGDSFTYGLFVNTKESWPEQLEDLLNNEQRCKSVKFEVINLGVGGFDIQYIVKRYKEIGAKYNPDMILWLESGSGLSRNMEEMAPMIEECEKTMEPTLVTDDSSVSQKYFRCWDKTQKELLDKYTFDGFIDKVTVWLDGFYELVDHSKVYYISFESTYSEGDSEAVFEKWRLRYPQAHIESRIPNLHDSEVLEDHHPSPIGHRKIAKEMRKLIEEEHPELFKCN